MSNVGIDKDATRAERVTRAVSDYRALKWKLEEDLKRIVKEKLAVQQAEIDSLVREMYDADPKKNKAAVARALMTSDRATVDRILARTEGLAPAVETGFADEPEIVGDARFSYDKGDQQLKVKSGGQMATFDVEVWADGQVMLSSHDDLWNDDYSVRNEIVSALDGGDITVNANPLAVEVNKFLEGAL